MNELENSFHTQLEVAVRMRNRHFDRDWAGCLFVLSTEAFLEGLKVFLVSLVISLVSS